MFAYLIVQKGQMDDNKIDNNDIENKTESEEEEEFDMCSRCRKFEGEEQYGKLCEKCYAEKLGHFELENEVEEEEEEGEDENKDENKDDYDSDDEEKYIEYQIQQYVDNYDGEHWR